MLNLLRKKVINKIKCSRSLPDPDFLGVTINSHVIYFWFLPFSRHLRFLPKLVDLKQKTVTGEEILDYLKRKDC